MGQAGNIYAAPKKPKISRGEPCVRPFFSNIQACCGKSEHKVRPYNTTLNLVFSARASCECLPTYISYSIGSTTKLSVASS